ncbi:hypothetical protein SprV_0602171200 [Sparganum proliferum]
MPLWKTYGVNSGHSPVNGLGRPRSRTSSTTTPSAAYSPRTTACTKRTSTAPADENKAAFYRIRYLVQQQLRKMQEAWTARKAEEIQGHAGRNEWENFFSAIKAVYVETNADLDLPPPLNETIRAVQQLSSGKALGSDAIHAEIYKHGGPQLIDHLTAHFQVKWQQGEFPQDFMDAIIAHLYKWKGNRQHCDNHRGISLLNTVGKIFARILLNPLNYHLEQGRLPESQCGLRRHRRTTDINFAARQLQEKCREMRTYLCSSSDESLRHGESQRTVKNNAEIWLSRAIHSDGAPAPRWHDGVRHGQRSCLRGIRSDQQSEAGLRPRAYSLQPHVLCHADGRLP